MFVEVCGPIASGKTTFVRAFSAHGGVPVHERYQENPFLVSFYSDPARFSLETELCFLLIHYHQIKVGSADLVRPLLCDFSITLDRAYADVTLSVSRNKLFRSVADELAVELRPPRLLVQLNCHEEVLLDRIHKRGRASEQGISIGYLESLSEALDRRVTEVSKSVPVIRIDSHEHDFRGGLEGHDFLPTLLQYLK